MKKITQFVLLIQVAWSSLHGAETTKVVMQLDWILNAQFAGLYQAVEQGFFKDAGLEVEIRPSVPKQKTVPAVLAESLAFGSAESNILLKSHAEGAPIKAVATMFQGSPLGWMYVVSNGVQSFEDLAGKRIGIHPDGEKIISLVTRQMEMAPDDFTLPHVGYDIEILLSGQVDAMQAYSIDEFVKLQLATKGKGGMFMAKDLGYSAYSQVIFTSAETIAQHPSIVRSFLAAVQKGWSYALDNKDATVDLILEKYNPELDREYQLASLRKIDELVRPDGAAPLAPIRREVFARSLNQYLENGILKKGTDVSDLLDLRFNPAP